MLLGDVQQQWFCLELFLLTKQKQTNELAILSLKYKTLINNFLFIDLFIGMCGDV